MVNLDNKRITSSDISLPNNTDKVRMFHEAFGLPSNHGTKNGLWNKESRLLRFKLIAEEFIELAEALGIDFAINESELHINEVQDEYDVVETADALGDIEYLVHGSYVQFGIDGPAVFDEIHRSNMSKLGEDGKPIFREDGKVLKGPNYFKPDIKEFMN